MGKALVNAATFYKTTKYGPRVYKSGLVTISFPFYVYRVNFEVYIKEYMIFMKHNNKLITYELTS